MNKQTEALKLALSTLNEVRTETFRLMRNGQKLYAEEKVWSTIVAIKEALAQPEQELVAWLLTDKNINSLQVDSIQRLINRLNHAHHTDLRVRINGQDEWFQADWLKHMVRVTPTKAQAGINDRHDDGVD